MARVFRATAGQFKNVDGRWYRVGQKVAVEYWGLGNVLGHIKEIEVDWHGHPILTVALLGSKRRLADVRGHMISPACMH
jgi:hypothetical protein